MTPDTIGPDTLTGLAGAAGSLAVILGLVKFVVIPAVGLFRGTSRFLDDWFGHDDNPGMKRQLKVLEHGLTAVKEEQARVSRELTHNGGSSMKDAVRRIEEQQQESERIRIETREADTLIRHEDRARLDLLAGLVGGMVGEERQARIAGHIDSAVAWEAMKAAVESTPADAPDDPHN